MPALMPGADVTFRPASLHPVTLEFRLSWGLDAREGCYAVTGYTTDESTGLSSVRATLGSTPECVPVPELSVGVLLLVGVAWLGAARALGPVVGRWLAANGKRYPRP